MNRDKEKDTFKLYLTSKATRDIHRLFNTM